MQVNVHGVEHNVRQIEKNDSRLCRLSDNVGYTLLQCDYNSVHP